MTKATGYTPRQVDAVQDAALDNGSVTLTEAVDAIRAMDATKASLRAGRQAISRLVASRLLEPERTPDGEEIPGSWVPTVRSKQGHRMHGRPRSMDRNLTEGGRDPNRSLGKDRSKAAVDEEEARKLLKQAQALEEAGLEGLLSDQQRELLRVAKATIGGDDWRTCLPALFPRQLALDFAPCHAEFWDHVWAIQPGVAPDAFVALWARDLAKSSSMEVAAIMLAARGVRRYFWYICSIQEASDDHLNSIEALLTSSEVASVYPGMASRGVATYGPKEWRANRLVTADGSVFDAIGLDKAARGRRYEEQRPDCLIFDDLDESGDTPARTEKRIRTLTRKILPAGSNEAAVLAGQNMIHGRSIFARLGRVPGAPEADFLARRKVSGPIPLIRNMQWQRRNTGDGYEITGGEPAWPARGIAGAQEVLDRIGLTAFLVECQHEEGSLGGGIGEHLDFELGRGITICREEEPPFRLVCAWVDPAVTSTDTSDSCAIVVDAIASDPRDKHIYRLFAWERISDPLETIKLALNVAAEHGAAVLGIETIHGRDLWRVAYQQALQQLLDDPESELAKAFEEHGTLPKYEQVTGTSQSKPERAQRMISYYDLGRFRHREGACFPLEAGLKRFPAHKPYDVVDAAVWGAEWMSKKLGDHMLGRKPFRMISPSGGGAEISVAKP